MKKGKTRNKRKKTRSRLLWIAIAVIGIAAVISAVCVAGMLATKENAWRTPEELLVEYMDHIPKQEYEEMYAMLHIEASGNISQEDFIKRNSAIYEGIEVQNMAARIGFHISTYFDNSKSAYATLQASTSLSFALHSCCRFQK